MQRKMNTWPFFKYVGHPLSVNCAMLLVSEVRSLNGIKSPIVNKRTCVSISSESNYTDYLQALAEVETLGMPTQQ